MTRPLASASVLLVAALASAGCDSRSANAGEAAIDSRTGRIYLGEQAYAFTVTTCLPGALRAPQDFLMLGAGTAPDGRPFDVQADGRHGRVELRVKGEAGAAAAIYASAFEPGTLRLDQGKVAARGPFQRITEGGQVDGRIQAPCITP